TPEPPKVASPPRDPRPPRLPPNWKSATDTDGCVYYYHAITRKTQWDIPTWDSAEEDPTKPSDAKVAATDPRLKANNGGVGNVTEEAKKAREIFRSKMSQHVVHCLNSYRKSDCQVGRITSTDDFKKLARKLTYNILMKEIKQVIVWDDLEYNANVKHKAKEYVKKYMAKMGPIYKAKDDD
uniref:WW domain-containing protein n=1 Tax=Ciona savignyi TaxID=51511 RepID=H2YKZ5_CIOSA